MRIGLVASIVALSATVAAPAAAAATPEEQKIARQHYDAGTAAYNLGEFLHAAEEYRQAYKAIQEPVILYNIAQAYRLGNDMPQALFFYRSYLRNLPSSANRKEVEKRIQKLEELVAAQQKAVATAPPIRTLPAPVPDMAQPAPVAPSSDETPAARPKPAVPNTEAPSSAAAPVPAVAAPVKPPPPPTGDSERAQPILTLIRSKRDGFRFCYDQWSRKHPGVPAKITLVLNVRAEGLLENVEFSNTGFREPEIEKCMTELAKTLTYPKSPSGKLTRFAYPFEFKPH